MLISTAGSCMWPHTPGPELVLVLPDGYRGLVILSSEDPGGEDAAPVDNVVTLHVSSEGRASVKGKLPTLEWHRVAARHKDGSPVPVSRDDGGGVADDAVALRPVGLDEGGQDWYVVGTFEDLKKAAEKKRGFKFGK